MTPPERIHPGAVAAARRWPLTITYGLGERVGPDHEKHVGWQFHVRCTVHDCGQSVFQAGNDSGAYTWTLGAELEPMVIAHIFQCHRADMGLPAPELDEDDARANKPVAA